MSFSRPRGRLGLILLALLTRGASAEERPDLHVEKVRPFVEKYCVSCHGERRARAELDLSRYPTSREVIADFRRWSHVVEFIREGEMPPARDPQPSPAERQEVVDALETLLMEQARRDAGDPGTVLPRRLTRTELDLSISALCGVDLRVTADFPPDPAAGEGFTNTGEALRMSPSLLEKQLAAARQASTHLVLGTGGISFAPFPVTSYAERKALAEEAIITFYREHEVRTLDYLVAAWRHRHSGRATDPESLASTADEEGLSPRYLALVWNFLHHPELPGSPLEEIGEAWEGIPPPRGESREVPPEIRELLEVVETSHALLFPGKESLIRSSAGNWPISHLDHRRRRAAARDRLEPGVMRSEAFLHSARLKAPGGKNRKQAAGPGGLTLGIRLTPLGGQKGSQVVVLEEPRFSKSHRPSRRPGDREKHEVRDLHELLREQAPEVFRELYAESRTESGDVNSGSLVLEAPALLEIPLPEAMQEEIEGRHFLLSAKLHPGRGREGSVLVEVLTNGASPGSGSGASAWLAHEDSDSFRQGRPVLEAFCETFPRSFAHVDPRRGLAAGFHLVEGFFRDDLPLVNRVLSDSDREVLDGLWRELHFITRSAETLLRGFVWFERSERHVLHDPRFDFLRAEDPRLVEAETLARFEKLYLEKLKLDVADDDGPTSRPDPKRELVRGFFRDIREGLELRKSQEIEAGRRGLEDLLDLAERAYRRPLRDRERESLLDLHRELREQGLEIETALRGVFSAILLSPQFCYRYGEAAREPGVHPLSPHELASRLSYFLGSTLPDEPLLEAARSGRLTDPEVLRAQVRRLLRDPRIETFAREFFGQWLRYDDFLERSYVHAPAFPGYDDELKRSLHQEPTRMLTRVLREDLPLLSLVEADFTYLDERLARHYGGELERRFQEVTRGKRDGDREDWHLVEGLASAGRGGLAGMGVILTRNSSGERTSPVQRGFWVVHHLLGQHFPPPPADVPELPDSEKKADRSLRELLAEHTRDPDCARCHVHFDGLGLALEGFDPVGRRRSRDLAGRPIDDRATFEKDHTGQGLEDLKKYLIEERRDDLVRTFCRKLLGYALGRSVILSDRPLLLRMEEALRKDGARISTAIEMVVTSRQFLHRRGRETVEPATSSG